MSYDGFINLDKEIGGSSQHAVSALKRLLHEKAGHCGTLDPLAGGVLPVCVGKATRLADIVMRGDKTYAATVCFGRSTESYDAGGEVTAEADASMLTREQVAAALPRLIGEIEQTAPVISAIKKDGIPLYKRARRGEAVTAPCRRVRIDAIRLVDFVPGKLAYAKVEVDCGHGVYIRSLAHDLGEAVGLPAYLTGLRRTRCGNFRIEDAYTLAQIEEMLLRDDRSFLRPMEDELADVPKVTAAENRIYAVSHGNDIYCPEDIPAERTVQVTDGGGKLLALGRTAEDGNRKIVKIDKVFIEPRRDLICAVGNFDGLHLGHRALFATLAARKKACGGKTAALTFAPHPLELITGQAPPLLTAETLKNELLLEYFGVDKVITIPFTQEVMNSDPRRFVEEVVAEQVHATELVVGYNFTFAKDGAGNAGMLKELCAERGIGVTVVDEVSGRYGAISSTHIREKLDEGDLDAVNDMLGYWFVTEGVVEKGNQIGRTIGFPTANFRLEPGQAMPPKGVYAVRVQYDGHTYGGVANFGFKPTIGGEVSPLMEACLFDAELDLYGEKIRVWLGRFLRPEKKFADVEELKREIAKNCREAREFLAATPQNKHLPKVLK